MTRELFFNKASDPTAVAVIDSHSRVNYAALYAMILDYRRILKRWDIQPGEVVALYGDFTPASIAFLLALIDNGNIIVPLTFRGVRDDFKERLTAVHHVIVDDADGRLSYKLSDVAASVTPPYRFVSDLLLYKQLRAVQHPGLVLFTSGSTGEPKAVVHDFSKLLQKFHGGERRPMRTLAFLLWDHWGGLNTMFHVLANGGTLVTTVSRQPDDVCKLIEQHRIELLPVSPTFLNLLLISEAYKRYDLTSVKRITYGTEPMPQVTLDRLRGVFPLVKFQQTYGLIELGVMRSKSRDDGSLWVKLGGEGFETRVRDGMLEIKAASAMLGYLNAPSPFTEDGWFRTGDAVEQDGDYYRVLGRVSETINVGGEKVHPSEVENVIQQMDNVAEVTVYGERNAITGQIVCARVRSIHPEDEYEFTARLKRHCTAHLRRYQVPVRVVVDDADQFNERYKKKRIV